MNDQKLRVGVVGLGFAGRTALEAFSELPDVEVVALAGLEKDILTSLGEKHGVPHLYEKWEDLLETEGLEAVSIGAPTALHAPIALKALEKGLHVLCGEAAGPDGGRGRLDGGGLRSRPAGCSRWCSTTASAVTSRC